MNGKDGKFIPSKRLLHIIRHDLTRPNREVIEIMHREGLNLGTYKNQLSILKHIVSEEIDGFLTNLAKHCMVGVVVPVSDNNEFTRESRDMLVDRLGLDSEKNLDMTFDNLRKEMSVFFTVIRNRKWGKIMADDSGIKIIVEDRDVFRIKLLHLNSRMKSY